MAAMERVDDAGEEVKWLSPEEAWRRFDAHARSSFGMSGEEFLRRWDTGEFNGLEEDARGRAYNDLVMMATTVRPATVEEGRIRFRD